MKRTSVTDEQIIGIQAEHGAGAKCPDLYREHGMPEGTVYNRKASFGGMTVSEAKRPKALEDQNAKLKKRPAGQMLDLAAIKDLITKNGTVCRRGGPVGALTRIARWVATRRSVLRIRRREAGFGIWPTNADGSAPGGSSRYCVAWARLLASTGSIGSDIRRDWLCASGRPGPRQSAPGDRRAPHTVDGSQRGTPG